MPLTALESGLETGTKISITVSSTDPGSGDLTLLPHLPGEGFGPDGAGRDMVLVENAKGERRLAVPISDVKDPPEKAYRRAGGRAAGWLLEHSILSARLPCQEFRETNRVEAIEAFCEGLLLGGFRFDTYKSATRKYPAVKVCLVAGEDSPIIEAAVKRGAARASGVNLARRIAEEPPNVINPVSLAERAAALAREDGLACRVLGDAELADLGAGGLIAVGLGSQTPSQLIVLEYPGRGSGVGSPPVVLVGKALTFDSGGYMVKSRSAIISMKYDKCGGAAVLGVLHSLAQLGAETPVTGVIAAAENMISADAFRPGDILRTLSGKTVEINNTDAEGRLVLADALAYAGKFYRPRCLIDIATLTYGVITALGAKRAGLLSNDDALAQALLDSGERTGEHVWRLPLDEEYLYLLQSDAADLKNYSGTSEASPITAGLFLQQFAPAGVPWAHLDILGTATAVEDLPYCQKGATGFGVRLLVDFISRPAANP